MNQQGLVDVVAKDTETSKAVTTRFPDSLITTVQDEVAKGGAVRLADFDTLEKAAVAACTGYNPKTGAPIKTPLIHKPEFASGVTFKDLVKD